LIFVVYTERGERARDYSGNPVKATGDCRVQRSDRRNNCYTSNCYRPVVMLSYL